MKNSALKRIIAVVLCLVVFAGSELTGVTNIVGDLFASENSEIEMDAADPVEETEEIVLSEEEPEPAEEEPQPEEETEEASSDESQTAGPSDEIPSDVSQSTDSSEISAEETQDDETEASADTEGENGEVPVVNGEGEDESAPVTDTNGEEESENPDGEKSQDGEKDSQETEASAGITKDQEGEIPNGDAAETEGENPEDTENGEETEVLDEEENGGENEEEEEPEAFDEEYKDGQVIIRVEAEPGVVPNGTELSVKKIVQQDVEALDDEEEIKEAEELNAKYEDIQAELELTVADDDTKEIAAFVAYDVNFLLTDEDGVTAEIEPDGEVSVSMEFEEAYLPEEIAEKAGQIDIESIDVIHMEEAEEDEESETGLKSEVVADADVSTTENAVEKAEFTTGSGKTFVITWTENDLGEREYVCETDDATIKVTAAKGVVPDGALLKVVPILADNEATQKQYQDVEKKLLEKAESEAYEIAGFLAYDISFTDEAGAKLEPNGEVKVAIDYKKAAIPEELKDLDSAAYAQDDTEDAEEDDADQAESAASGNKSAEAVSGTEAEETSLPESGREDGTSESGNSQSGEAAITNITIMHLEENDQGQVTKVVDMGAEGKVTELNSTKDQKVTSTEFVTESFSTFTIVWMDKAGTWEQSIDVKFYRYSKYVEMPHEGVPEVPLEDLVLTWEDETGGKIDLSTITIIDSGEWNDREKIIFKTSDISENGRWKEYYRLKDKEGNSYVFYKAIIVQTNEVFNANLRADLETILYDGSGFYYTNSKEMGQCFPESEGWKRELRFYYIPELKSLNTIDNNDYGITMRMINYTDHTLQDSLLGTPYGSAERWWNNEAITQGAVKPRLENGYPVTKGVNGSVAGNNLAVLFGGASNPNATVQKVNGLFLEDIYEDTGYFQYSSFQNYACLENEANDKGEYDFTVYNGIGSTEYTKFEYHPFYRGNFFPYSEITPGDFAQNYNKYSADGKELSNEDIRKGELLYRVGEPDYCFGMYIEAAFVQPQGGMVEHNGEKSPMEYKFTGDDDLWVFIDDSLVLDIGGAHHACSGSINFKDGTVKIDGKSDTNIREMFKTSGYFPDGSVWEDAKADLYFDGNTFKDYSTHRIKMFYMEHGETAEDNASNLQVTMNLPTIDIPTGTVQVKKELDNTDKEAYKDVKFAFQVFAQQKTGENEAGDTYSNTEYVALDVAGLKDEKGNLIECDTEKNVFYLKPDQVAVFEGLQSNRKYYVKEIGVESNLYDKVTIEGGPRIEEINSDGESTFVNGVESSALPVEARPSIIFTNKCSAANSRELRITKAKEGVIPEQQFSFQVYLGDQKDPYKGPYVLEKADGSKTEVTSSDGKIQGVSVGDTIVIDKIMSGTKYKVVEVELAEPFVAPTIDGKNVKTDKTETLLTNKSTVANTFEGEILLDYDAVVTVTNKTTALETRDLHIKKEMKEGDPFSEAPFTFQLMTNDSVYTGNYYLQDGTGKKYQYDSQNKKLEPLTDNQYGTVSNGTVYIPAGYIAVIPDLEVGTTFQVTEQLSDAEKETYVYPPQMKVNGTTVDEKEEIASGKIIESQNMVTVINSLKSYSYTWEIVKVGSVSGTAPLKGAMFELTSDFNDGKSSLIYSGESGDNGVIVWKQDGTEVDPGTFQTGQYKLKETKAPENHMISGKEWTIILTYDGVTIQEPKDDGTGLQTVSPKSSSNKDQYTYEFLNAVIYELPSTGGAGIFGYMISGVLLMIAGVLILYKRKYAGRC